MLITRGQLLATAGRKDEARAVYQAMLVDPAVEEVHRKAAREALGALGKAE